MDNDQFQKLLDAINRIANGIAQLGRATQAHAPTPARKQAQGAPRKDAGKETFAITISSDGQYRFKDDDGGFYKGTIIENGKEENVSLGIYDKQCDVGFELGDIVKCTASRRGRNDRDEIALWFSHLIELIPADAQEEPAQDQPPF